MAIFSRLGELVILVILAIYSFIVLADQDGIYLGEKQDGDYFGPESPLVLKRSGKKESLFSDDHKHRSLLSQVFSSELIELEHFATEKLTKSLSCTNWNLSQHAPRLEFAHRLIALSYLFEAGREFHELLKQRDNTQTCLDEFKKVTCSAKSFEMKTFAKNFKAFLMIPAEEHKVYTAKEKNLSHYLRDAQSTAGLRRSCRSLAAKFQIICGEEDQLHGIYSNVETFHLLLEDSFLTASEKSCLRAYKSSFKEEEKRMADVSKLVSFFYEVKRKEALPLGDVYTLGTLVEMEKLGISILKNESKEEELPRAEVSKVKSLSVNVPESKPSSIVSNTIKKKRVPANNIAPPKVLGHFEEKARQLKETDIKEAVIDLDAFRYDYVISLQLREKLEQRMSRFLSLASLKILKDQDGFGTKSTPVPLLLVKYLLEAQRYQEIHNLTRVLGEEFYIENDLKENSDFKLVKARLTATNGVSFKLLEIL